MDTPSVIYNPAQPSPKLPCGVFTRIQVATEPLGGTLIAWGLNPNFPVEEPAEFYVDFGYAGTDTWEALNTTPLTNTCFYYDAARRYWDQLANFYYRVRLVFPNKEDPERPGQCLTYHSQPQQANGVWFKRDWLLAREIVRKEYLLQRKRTNMTFVGTLLKRRRFGARCPDCKEHDTEEVINSRCERCYGTGFIGGYFKGIYYVVCLNAPWQREFKVDGQVSLRNDIVRLGRAVAYPYLDTKDVFVRKDTGERYYVNALQALAEIGGIPIVAGVELRLAPTTDVIYQIPLNGSSSSSTQSSSSGSPPAPDCDYRVGQNDAPIW